MSDSATSWTVASQAPLSMRFPRQEHWSGLPFPSPVDLPDPRIKPRSPIFQTDSLPSCHQGNQIRTNASHSSTREPTNQILAEKAKWVAVCHLFLWRQERRRKASERIPQERVGSGWVEERCEWENLKPVYFLVFFFWAMWIYYPKLHFKTLHFFNFKDFWCRAGIWMPKTDMI